MRYYKGQRIYTDLDGWIMLGVWIFWIYKIVQAIPEMMKWKWH